MNLESVSYALSAIGFEVNLFGAELSFNIELMHVRASLRNV